MMPKLDEIRWSLEEPGPPLPRHVALDVGPPPAGLNSRANLVAWWRWRYASLDRENARLGDLLVQVLSEAQSYRQVSQASLDALHDLTDTTRQQRQTIARLHDEIRRVREPANAVTV
ncbi:MAG TPA: hypothetical protein QGH10_18300 [Armatimonadota bacterium]|nr:hypothetical protein [Armatimonadota bacterium]